MRHTAWKVSVTDYPLLPDAVRTSEPSTIDHFHLFPARSIWLRGGSVKYLKEEAESFVLIKKVADSVVLKGRLELTALRGRLSQLPETKENNGKKKGIQK